MSIGERWREAREAAGLSAAKAAAAASVHENTIYLLENDKRNDGVTIRLCKQIADVYGVTLGAIFSEEESRSTTVELRPLQDLLTPLTIEDRISFVRNVVANARFMGQLLAVGDVRHSAKSEGAAYNPLPAIKKSGEDGWAEPPYINSHAPSRESTTHGPASGHESTRQPTTKRR